MISNMTLSDVAMAGMPSSVRSVVFAAFLPPQKHAAHPAVAAWPAAAAIAPQRKRRAATATRVSVDRSPF
jgi:hypothetical protein